jgi:hypothetical protein
LKQRRVSKPHDKKPAALSSQNSAATSKHAPTNSMSEARQLEIIS